MISINNHICRLEPSCKQGHMSPFKTHLARRGRRAPYIGTTVQRSNDKEPRYNLLTTIKAAHGRGSAASADGRRRQSVVRRPPLRYHISPSISSFFGRVRQASGGVAIKCVISPRLITTWNLVNVR